MNDTTWLTRSVVEGVRHNQWLEGGWIVHRSWTGTYSQHHGEDWTVLPFQYTASGIIKIS